MLSDYSALSAELNLPTRVWNETKNLAEEGKDETIGVLLGSLDEGILRNDPVSSRTIMPGTKIYYHGFKTFCVRRPKWKRWMQNINRTSILFPQVPSYPYPLPNYRIGPKIHPFKRPEMLSHAKSPFLLPIPYNKRTNKNLQTTT